MSRGPRSKVTWVKFRSHIGQGPKRVPNKGRWAHTNVKLLHIKLHSSPRSYVQFNTIIFLLDLRDVVLEFFVTTSIFIPTSAPGIIITPT